MWVEECLCVMLFSSLIAFHFRLIWSSKLAVRQQHPTKSTCTLYQFRFYVVYVVCAARASSFISFVFVYFFLYSLLLSSFFGWFFFLLFRASERRFNMLSYVARVMQIWITYMYNEISGCGMLTIVICWCETHTYTPSIHMEERMWDTDRKWSRVNAYACVCVRASVTERASAKKV